MSDSKTLEDIKPHLKGISIAEFDFLKEKIRQQAVKWVKEDIEDYRNADLHLPAPPIGINIHNFIVRQRQKWKDRLNILEDDLQLNKPGGKNNG